MMPSWSNRRSISLLAALLVLVAAGVFGFLSGVSPALAQGTLTNPTNVTAVSNAAGELTLTWQGGDNADSYLLIAVHLETIAYETEVVAGGVAKTGTVTGLTGGANYLGIVVALQASADGLATQYGAARPVAVSEHLPADVEQLMCPMPGRTVAPRPTSTVRGDYDADNDGLIEVASLAQLDAIRYDRGGRGSPSNDDLVSYYGAFPNALAGMGCPEAGCTGYELIVDLDFDTDGNGRADSGDTYWNDGAGWLPIDGYGTVFDGGGHTIANLYINREFEYDARTRENGVGLFGGGYRGEISGVALTSVDVTGSSESSSVKVGGLVGYGYGSISDSCVEGAVTSSGRGAYSVGGLAGSVSTSFRPYGKIRRSYATGTVSGEDNVGGLVGSVPYVGFGSSISESYAISTVSGSHRVGGLVGSGGNISDSYATGTVSGSHRVGGLVGSGGGTISGSYATGAVSGTSPRVHYVGGLVGSSDRHISISDSYATGTVLGGGDVGGLVGSGGGTISGSYATGTVAGDNFADNVGGLVGSGSGSISSSYATGTVSGRRAIGGLVGSSLSSISGSYATGAVSGDRNVGGLIGDADDRSSISGSYATGTVSGSGDRVGGLAGSVGSADISGSYATGVVSGANYVGGLVGNGFGDIRVSYATGMVSGANDVGGLVGRGSSISGSYATGAVSGTFRVGGLIGQAREDTSSSYAVGRVSGSGAVGGLIGDNTGTVTDSYWDTVTSGQSHSDGGQGKTTSELQSPTGYSGIYANWNADLDDADRDRNPMTDGDDPWDFGTSSQYPVLKYGGLNVAQQRR